MISDMPTTPVRTATPICLHTPPPDLKTRETIDSTDAEWMQGIDKWDVPYIPYPSEMDEDAIVTDLIAFLQTLESPKSDEEDTDDMQTLESPRSDEEDTDDLSHESWFQSLVLDVPFRVRRLRVLRQAFAVWSLSLCSERRTFL